MSRPILIVGGAPRLRVDAVRFLSVAASGTTAVHLAEGLRARELDVELLLGTLARPEVEARRYDDRTELEDQLKIWLGIHPEGVVVMSAAINDYAVTTVERRVGHDIQRFAPGQKVPSGGDELLIRLTPASKVIDQLVAWGHRGPLIGFKYEDRATVLASAEALRKRTGAALVVANSLCQTVQALVSEAGVRTFTTRGDLMKTLTEAIAQRT